MKGRLNTPSPDIGAVRMAGGATRARSAALRLQTASNDEEIEAVAPRLSEQEGPAREERGLRFGLKW
jgi:hypothetical protein